MAWMIYLIGVLDNFACVVSALRVFAIIVFVSATVIYILMKYDGYYEEEQAKLYKLLVKSGISLLIITPIAIFTPSSKTVAAMYLLPKIAENKNINQVPDKLLQVFNAKLDEWVKELSKKEE